MANDQAPRWKYEVGDWVKYQDDVWKVIAVEEVDIGWIYGIRSGHFMSTVLCTDGDIYFMPV